MLWLEVVLSNKYELTTQKVGHLPGMPREGQTFNRTVPATPAGFELDANTRHAEFIVEQLNSTIARIPCIHSQFVDNASAHFRSRQGVAPVTRLVEDCPTPTGRRTDKGSRYRRRAPDAPRRGQAFSTPKSAFLRGALFFCVFEKAVSRSMRVRARRRKCSVEYVCDVHLGGA